MLMKGIQRHCEHQKILKFLL